MCKIADELYVKRWLAEFDELELRAADKIKAARLLERLARTPANRRRARMLLKLLERNDRAPARPYF